MASLIASMMASMIKYDLDHCCVHLNGANRQVPMPISRQHTWTRCDSDSEPYEEPLRKGSSGNPVMNLWERGILLLRNPEGPCEHSPAQPSSAQHMPAQPSPAQHNPTQHSPAQPSSAHHSTAQNSPAQFSTVQHITAQPSPAQPSTAQPGRAQHNPAQPSLAHPIPAQHSPA